MASTKEFITFVSEQCDGLSVRAMMGDYVLYYRGKVVGGIYDNRLLIKPTPSANALMPAAVRQLPYDGAKEMLLVENIEDKEFMQKLFDAVYAELPERKPGKNRL
ncbi:MAG: TfoX/Sxy family protein [Christensenellales bacterium]